MHDIYICECVSSVKRITLLWKITEVTNSKCSSFASSAPMHLFFTPSRSAKCICPRMQGIPATPTGYWFNRRIVSYYPKVLASSTTVKIINHYKLKPATKLTRDTVIFLSSFFLVFDSFFMSHLVDSHENWSNWTLTLFWQIRISEVIYCPHSALRTIVFLQQVTKVFGKLLQICRY